MKRNLLLAMACITGMAAHAQMVGPDAYMKGNYVEIGINGANGYEGIDTTLSPLLPGMHCRTNREFFGFTANPQMDGWVNFDGDFYTPGTPENGWGIQIIDNAGTINISKHNNRFGLSEIPGNITSFTYTGGITTVTWNGNYTGSGYNLDVKIVYELNDTALFYTTNVTITNNGPGTIDELYYYRNIDPDNNITLTGNYNTFNTIVSQPTMSTLACVSAQQSLPWVSSYALVANDPAARVSFGGFSNRDARNIWNGGTGLTGTPGDTNSLDVAVSLAYKYTVLAPADSVNPVFKSVFGVEQLEDEISAAVITNTNELPAGLFNIYPNPAGNVINVQSADVIKEITIYNSVGTRLLNNSNQTTAQQVDISSLKPGIYFIQVKTAAGNATQRFVKQ